MKLPVLISYTFDSKASQLVYDLHKDVDRTRVMKFLIWANNKGVACTIQPMSIDAYLGRITTAA